MKVTCKFSGEELVKYTEFPFLHLADIHPIFGASVKVLFRLSEKFNAPDAMTIRGKKLLFLAVAHSTGLMQFHVPASPSPMIVESNFSKLLYIAGWIGNIANRQQVKFPSFVVRRETQDLSNFNAWLAALYEIRKEFHEGVVRQEEIAKLKQMEASIEVRVRALESVMWSPASKAAKERNLNKMLADWAIAVSEAPADHIGIFSKLENKAVMVPTNEYWHDMLTTNEGEMFDLRMDHVKEMYEYFELNLPHGTTAAKAVMDRCIQLMQYQQKALGLFEILGEDGRVINYLASRPDLDNDDDSGDIDNTTAVPVEPARASYPTDVAFSIAKAQYRMRVAGIRLQPKPATKGGALDI